jgi:hypothetical protein
VRSPSRAAGTEAAPPPSRATAAATAPLPGLSEAAPFPRSSDVAPLPGSWFDVDPPAGLMTLEPPLDIAVAADWKVVVEQWLELSSPIADLSPAQDCFAWPVAMWGEALSDRLYRRVVECVEPRAWRRLFIAPNQLIETRPDGLSVIQVLPVSAGKSRVRRLDYSVLSPEEGARAALYLARRLGPFARRTLLHAAQSVQRALIEFGYESQAGAVSPAVAWFRRRLTASVPALAFLRPPNSM